MDTLLPCGNKPNCVCSLDTRTEFYIKPFDLTQDPSTSWERLQKIIEQMPRIQIVKKTDSYLKYEFKSLLFRFVDDVEFTLNKENNTIEVRSASRVGYSDMGVNRKRIESIRKLFQQDQK